METKMLYRPIGNTGMSASIIGLGTEHLDNKPYEIVEPVIKTALEQGVNIMDLFMPGEEVRTNIGKALAGQRDKIIIQGHIGSTDISQQYDVSRDLPTCKTYFENLLKYLKTDYIDIGMLFFIDSEDDLKNIFDKGIVDYAQSLKKNGIIRAIGASSHNPVTAAKLVETGVIDLLMFSINPAFDMIPSTSSVFDLLDHPTDHGFTLKIDPVRARLYKLCEQKGVAITVMKTLGAGKLLSNEHSPFNKAMSAAQCIHYALTRPAVVSTLLGCSAVEHVLESVSYLNTDEKESDYSAVISECQGNIKAGCMYCNHCLPCPKEINIAEVTKYTDIAALDEKNIPPSVAANYKALAHHGSECIACGNCEKRCPFSVPVVRNMQKAAVLFGV